MGVMETVSKVVSWVSADADRVIERLREAYRRGHQETEESYNHWRDSIHVEDAEQRLRAIKDWIRGLGWTVMEVRDIQDVAPGGQNVGRATGMTLQMDKEIYLKQSMSASTKIYVLCHELGHALGVEIELGDWTKAAIIMGVMRRIDVPQVVEGEAMADLTTMLVLMGMGVGWDDHALDYFINWRIGPEVLEKVKGEAVRVAGLVLKAAGVGGQVGVEREQVAA